MSTAESLYTYQMVQGGQMQHIYYQIKPEPEGHVDEVERQQQCLRVPDVEAEVHGLERRKASIEPALEVGLVGEAELALQELVDVVVVAVVQ